MARSEAPDIFMSLPLEIRHSIFEYLSARASSTNKNNPKQLLLHWFEKEFESLIATYMHDHSTFPEPIINYSQNDVIFSSEDDGGSDSDTAEEDEADTGEEDENDEDDEGDEDDDEDEYYEDDEEEEEISNLNASETVEHVNGYKGLYRPFVYPNAKWRHIPNFISLTHFPPPVELLLTSRQLEIEAKNWFYNVAVLRINVTRNFAHTSFFEEALGQIADAAFSPMQNIRKAEVTFVWDSAWIRIDTTGRTEAVFPALLRQRASFVHKILLRAPDLRKVDIHWNDSIQDNESANLKMEILKPFHTLSATVKVEEHYIAADAKPKKRSIAGKRRLEFENFLSAMSLGHLS